jgi:hypothetical protein
MFILTLIFGGLAIMFFVAWRLECSDNRALSLACDEYADRYATQLRVTYHLHEQVAQLEEQRARDLSRALRTPPPKQPRFTAYNPPRPSAMAAASIRMG